MSKKNLYEASITFYAEDDIHEKIEGVPNVNVDDYYLDDDGDWCIDCTVYVATGTASFEAVDKKVSGLVKHVPAPWDYHYIKGVNTGFWWQP